jgi:type I restriction enzyme, S subunit
VVMRVIGIANANDGIQKRASYSPEGKFGSMFPPLPLQEKFAAAVRRVEWLRAQRREADRQTEHFFQTLLHRAFAENGCSQPASSGL